MAARELPRAQAFARRHGVPRAYGSYRELAEDPDVGERGAGRGRGIPFRGGGRLTHTPHVGDPLVTLPVSVTPLV